jgi:hypothetical protein
MLGAHVINEVTISGAQIQNRVGRFDQSVEIAVAKRFP